MDETGNYSDWVELYNSGGSSVNLLNYGLSDSTGNLYKFTLPQYTLNPNSRIVIFASGSDKTYLANHWETAIKHNDSFRYFIGTSQPDTNWRNNSFNDLVWSQANGSFGRGIGDDNINLPLCNSVMARAHFAVADTSNLLEGVFNMDYEDGYIAYLNGVEIARYNMLPARPAYNVYANQPHQALNYQGLPYDSVHIDHDDLNRILRVGDNVLAVEVHTAAGANGNMECSPFLSFAVKSSSYTYPAVPSWFHAPPQDYYHANFNLKKTGQTVYLTNSSGTIIDQHTYANVTTDNSVGRIPDGSVNWCYFGIPTPNASNNSTNCTGGYATIPIFSLAAGFYPGAQQLTLTTSFPGGEIRYTTNGNTPTLTSTLYSGPIQIDTSQTVRAAVFAPAFIHSQIVSNTYIISQNIHLPVFSLTTDSLNLWDYNTGIYVLGPNASSTFPYVGANYWEKWEKPVSVEYFDKQKNRVFKYDGLFGISGGDSRTFAQKSFEMKLSKSLGTSSLNFPLIPDKSYLTTWSDYILRNTGSDWQWAHMRDGFMQRLLKKTNLDYNAYEPCVVYLNGTFWGVYEIRENTDAHLVEANYGYSSSQLDFLQEKGPLSVLHGTDSAFYSMYDYAMSANQTTPAFLDSMSQMWDMKNFTDNFVAETYTCNEDYIGQWTNNIRFWRPRQPGGKFRYIMNDLDAGFGLYGFCYFNTLDTVLHPIVANHQTDLLNAMLNNPVYKNYFINRYADLINTIYLPAAVNSLIASFRDSLAPDMDAFQFAKWGSSDAAWRASIADAISFANCRPGNARNYIQSEFSMTSQVILTLNASPVGAGRIQISTITPTTLPWSGVYFNGNPVTITAIPNPGYTFDHWHSNAVITTNDFNQSTTYNFTSTDQITAYFSGSPTAPLITFSEINYHSDTIVDGGDWVELHNYGTADVDISGWNFKDEMDNHSFVFPTNTVIAAGGYLVLAEDLTKFSAAYPSVTNVIGSLGFGFSNSGEQLRLFDYRDSLYISSLYSDQIPWPVTADGLGYTCELLDSLGDLNDGNNWFAGCLHGSPGRAYSSPTATISSAGSANICTGGNVVLNAGFVAGYTYQWQHNHVDIAGETGLSYTATDSGSYTVAVTYQSCAVISDSIVVTITPVANDPVVTSGYSCGAGPVTISATSNAAITWYNAPNGTLLGSGNSFTTPTISTTTTYYALAGTQCPSNFIPVDAVINQITAAPVANDVTNCGPGVVTLTATDTAVIHWYNLPVGGTLLQTGSSYTTLFLNSTTIFYVEAGTTCPSARIPVSAIITSATAPTTTDNNRCGPGTLLLTATAADPVSWYTLPVGGTFLGTTYNFTTPSISVTTTYYAEANNGCASVRVAATATINDISLPPQVTSSFNCGTGDVTLTATSPDPISWYDAPTAGNLLGTGNSLTLLGISITTVVYAEAGTLCPSTRSNDTAFIYTPPVVNLGVDIILSSPDSATLDAGAGFTSYLWSTGATTQIIVVNSTNTYSVIVTDANGCTATDTVMVTVYVGIASINSSSAIDIYPNPVHDLLHIEFPGAMTSEKMQLRMTDVTGRIILSEAISGNRPYSVDMKNLSKGIYILVLENENMRVVKEVVVN